MVRRVHRMERAGRRSLGRPLGPAVAFWGALTLIAALWLGPGLGVFGAICGIVVAAAFAAFLDRALASAQQPRLTPADRITLTRAVLTVGIAALVAQSFVAEVHTVSLLVLAATALVLDGVDGRVARSTGTVHELGARFDMEIDALLIAVLGVYVAAQVGWWVLVIGAAHYLLLIARHVWPWLRAPLPPRYWCKVVAAMQGVVLTVAASGLLPAWLVTSLLVVSGVLLAESFGREVWQLHRQRSHPDDRQGEVGLASREERIAVELGAVRR